MTRILLEIDGDEHVAPMLDVLAALSFVRTVRAIRDADEPVEQMAVGDDDSHDFFAVAGIWGDRKMSKEDLRAAAWPKRAR